MMRLTQLRTSKRSSADTGIQKPIDSDIQERLSKPKLAQLIKKNKLGLAKLILHLQALTKTGQVKSGLMRPSKRISPWLNSQTAILTSLGSKVLSMAQHSESEICKSINTATQELGSRALCHMMRLTQLRTSKRSSADTGIQKPIDSDIQERLSKPKLAQLIKKNKLGLAKLILHLQALTKTGQVKSGLMRPSKRISPWLNSQTLLICFSLTLI
jgi:hypothetical protein